ncbi:hypothetical protein ABZ912_60680 [Nonomuraea angiospora]|uniref:hypothetical protein n=1 Tax=Nonomuraea angiospora TaxID=46172 RepID=UPI00340BDABF
MNRLFGKVSDAMLGLLVPRKEAHALPATWIGCCDSCMCIYLYPNGTTSCLRCSCQMCGA